MSTPCFMIKKNALDENLKSFQNALTSYWSNSRLAYSVKTNSLPWLLKYLGNQHVIAEVVSDEEYQLAQLCGFKEQEIIFNGPIKGSEILTRAVEQRSYVNMDSKSDEQIVFQCEYADCTRIGLRINVPTEVFSSSDIGYCNDGFRFGYSEKAISSIIEEYEKKYSHRRIGLHLHCNSVTRSVGVYEAIARYAVSIIKKYDLEPSYIDMGGGFFGGVEGKPTAAQYIKVISDILREAVDPSKTELLIEPGSAIVGSVIELHTSVLDVKDTLYARIVTTDGSRIHIDPLWTKKGYRYRLETLNTWSANCERQVICGYTCMDHDRIMIIDNRQELQVGDRIIYERVGAYSVTFGGPFIRYFPTVYVDCNGDLEMVRSPMTTNEYFRIHSVD